MVEILIADDSVFMRKVLIDILTREKGWEVVGEAGNGTRLVELYKMLKPDMVVTDVILPCMDGIDAIKQIIAFDPKARIVAISGSPDEKVMIAAEEAGADAFIPKLGTGYGVGSKMLPKDFINEIKEVLKR